MYTVKKLGSMWTVINSAGIIQFRSLRRVNCTDWVNANTPKTEQAEAV